MLTIQRNINRIRPIPIIGPILADGLQRLEDAVNNLAVNVGADPTGFVPQAPTIQGLMVKAANGLVHVSINDSNPISKNLHYFVEYSTDPAFSQPHVEHLGPSRGGVLNLPGKTDGNATQNFYLRGYSQYQGGIAGKPINFGGAIPTPVNPGGTTLLTLLPSTGSGTAPNNGERGGQGFGKVLKRK